jgi:glutathionylspermidine synthase
MQRIPIAPRQNWQAKVEEKGLVYHTAPDGAPYWDESAYYEFTSPEIDAIEKATYALNDLCLAAVEAVVQKNDFARFNIPPQFIEWVKRSWEKDERNVVGRFDLAVTPSGSIKLLEYNADTPTSLLEASVIQWYWMKDVLPTRDQFNNIHERLIEAWLAVAKEMPDRWYFASAPAVFLLCVAWIIVSSMH